MEILNWLGIPGIICIIIVGLFVIHWTCQLPKSHDDYDGPTTGFTLFKFIIKLLIVGALIRWGAL